MVYARIVREAILALASRVTLEMVIPALKVIYAQEILVPVMQRVEVKTISTLALVTKVRLIIVLNSRKMMTFGA